MNKPVDMKAIEDQLKQIGFPDSYAASAVALIRAQKYPPKSQKAFGDMALAKCRDWVANPFAADCPPVGRNIADPKFAGRDPAYIDRYNASIGIPDSLRSGNS